MWSQLRGWVFNRGVVSGAILGALFGFPFAYLIGAAVGLFFGVIIGAGLGWLNGFVLTAVVKRMYATRTAVRRRDILLIYILAIFTNVVPFYVILGVIGLSAMHETYTFTQAVNSMIWIAFYPSIIAGLAAAYFVRGYLVFADELWKGLSVGEKRFLFAQFKSEHVHQVEMGG